MALNQISFRRVSRLFPRQSCQYVKFSIHLHLAAARNAFMVWCFAGTRDNCAFVLSHLTKLRMEIYGGVHFTQYVGHGKINGEEFHIFHSVTIISTEHRKQLYYIYNNMIRTTHSYLFRPYWPSSVSIIILWNYSSIFLISNFRRVMNVVCVLLGNSPSSEFDTPTFRNTVRSIFISR
jgi:hypothetical protein